MMLGARGRVTDFLLGELKGLRLRGCADVGEIRDSSSSLWDALALSEFASADFHDFADFDVLLRSRYRLTSILLLK